MLVLLVIISGNNRVTMVTSACSHVIARVTESFLSLGTSVDFDRISKLLVRVRVLIVHTIEYTYLELIITVY